MANRVSRRRAFGAMLLAFGCSAAQAGGTSTILRVGIGAGCDFADLQSAINAASNLSADHTVIRLARDVMNTPTLQILDRNLTIDGRWSSCTGTFPVPIRRTLDGNGLDSVIRATTSGQFARSLTLRALLISGGGADNAISDRGGGLRVGGRVAATVLFSEFNANASVRGGGIAVEGAFASLTLDEGTIVGLGTGPANGSDGIGSIGLGGGIYCDGAQVTINNARVRGNTSSHDGGGIYLDNCDLTIEPEPSYAAGTGGAILQANQADRHGGAIFATGGSSVFWRSLPTGSYAGRAQGNSADGRGGTVFLDGASNFVGDWIRIEDSRADDRGGAFAVQDTSNLILRGGAGYGCTGVNCPGIFGTRGITQGEPATLIGGAVFAEGSSTVALRQQQVFDNHANNGSAMHLSGSNTNAELRGVLIARNVLYGVGNGTSTIELISSADATLRHVTMAGNFRVSDQFPGLERAASSIRANGNGSTIELRNSILWNDGNLVLRLLASAASSGSCVLAHESASFPPASVLDPLYRNTTGNNPDYSPASGSPAIDACAASGPNEVDLFGVARPQDLPDVANGAGAFDAGAIEIAAEFLFGDGFEDPLIP